MKLNSVQEYVDLLEVLDDLGYLVPFTNYAQELQRHGFTEHISKYDMKIIHTKEPADIISIIFFARKQHLRFQQDFTKGLVDVKKEG